MRERGLLEHSSLERPSGFRINHEGLRTAFFRSRISGAFSTIYDCAKSLKETDHFPPGVMSLLCERRSTSLEYRDSSHDHLALLSGNFSRISAASLGGAASKEGALVSVYDYFRGEGMGR